MGILNLHIQYMSEKERIKEVRKDLDEYSEGRPKEDEAQDLFLKVKKMKVKHAKQAAKNKDAKKSKRKS